jgi:ATP-dependent DNA ligase
LKPILSSDRPYIRRNGELREADWREVLDLVADRLKGIPGEDAPPQGREWLHEIKYDGYRMHARLNRGRAELLTRGPGLDA